MYRFLAILLIVTLAACESTGTSSSSRPTSRTTTDTLEENAAADQATEGLDGATDQEGPVTRADGSGGNPEELAVWRDPKFKKRFAESFLAESEVEPSVTLEERETMLAVLDLISTEKMDEAITMIETTRNDASSAVFDFTLANIYFQREDFDNAAANYDLAVEKFPKFLRAWKNLGLIHVRKGAFDKALPALTRVVELGGADSVTYGLLGYSYSSVENPVAAESAYRMANLLDPNTIDWKMGLARSFFRQRRFGDASALCGTLIKDNQERADLWMLQANAFIGLNQPMQAAQNIEFVRRLGKATPASLNLLGDIYVNQELFDMAVGAYSNALEKGPDANPDRVIRAAKILAARSALPEAKALVAQIQDVHGDRLEEQDKKDLLHIQARIAVAEGAGDEQARVLEEIVKIDPTDGEALILLGQHARRSGEKEKAVIYFERAANLEKYEADAKIRHAQLLVSEGKYKDALPLLRRAQQIKPRENIQQYLDQVERASKDRAGT